MSSIQAIKSIIPLLTSRGIGLLLQLILMIVLGRLLGAEGMGLYALYLSGMMTLASIADLGTPNHVLRNVSVLEDRGHVYSAVNFTLNILKMLLVPGLIMVITAYFFSWLYLQFADPLTFDLLWLIGFSALSAVSFIWVRVLSEALKGLGQVNFALIAETSLLPLGALIVVAVLYRFDWDITAESYLVLHLVLLIMVTAVMLRKLMMQYRIDQESLQTHEATPATFNRSQLSFWGAGLLNMWFLNMPVILLPFFATTQEIGIFSVAYRLIALASIVLVTLASLFAPRFARDYANRDADALASGLKQSQFLSVLVFLPMLLAFTIFSDQILGVFGDEFIAGKDLLMIMVVGQLLNAATGLVGFMMNMIHQEKTEFHIQLFTTMLLMFLIYLLGSFYGVYGVAISYALAIVIKNLASLYFSLYHINAMKRLAGATQ